MRVVRKRKRKRVPQPGDGVFGKIVSDYGPKKKSGSASNTSQEPNNVIVVNPQNVDKDGSGDQSSKTKKRRKNY